MLISPKTRWPKTRLIEYSLKTHFGPTKVFGGLVNGATAPLAPGARVIGGMMK